MVRYSLGTLIVGARFVCRHVSMQRALLAHGFDEGAAKALAEVAELSGQAEVRFEIPASPARPDGCTVIVRRMRGNHVEEWERPARRAAPVLPVLPAPPPGTGDPQ